VRILEGKNWLLAQPWNDHKSPPDGASCIALLRFCQTFRLPGADVHQMDKSSAASILIESTRIGGSQLTSYRATPEQLSPGGSYAQHDADQTT
jgi:hypothetical protein